MIHSRNKLLHTEEDTTTKQKTIRSHNTIFEKDCRDLTKINRQRKHEGFNRSPPTWNYVKIVRKGNAAFSRRKERAKRFYEVGCAKIKLEQEGEVSCGPWKVCEEGLPKVKLERKGKSLRKGLRRRLLKGQMRAENTWRALVEVWGCACCRGLGRAC